jgi:hypothetical protein
MVLVRMPLPQGESTMTPKPRPCQCGQPATERLTVRHRHPRAEFTPEAVDPHYVHGGGGIRSCGSPACEAEALLAFRAEVINYVREFSGRELDDSELETTIFRPELITYAEQPDGTMRESWPSPPGEAV